MGGGSRSRQATRRSPPRLLTRRELAARLQVAPGRIDKWIANGCPIAKRGAPGTGHRFDERQVREWAAGRSAVDVSMRDPVRRYLVALLRQVEASHQSLLEHYIPDPEWRPGWAAEVARVRATIARWVGRTAASLAAALLNGAAPPREELAVRDHVRALLVELSGGVTEEGPEPVADPVPPPQVTPRPEPETVDTARRVLLEARTELAMARTAVRGPSWNRREAVRFAVLDAVTKAKFTLWSGPLLVHVHRLAQEAAVDPARVRGALELSAREALRHLAIPDGKLREAARR